MDTNIKYLVDNNINIWNKDALNYSNSGKLGKGSIQTEQEFLKDICNGTQMPGELGRIYGAQLRDWNNKVPHPTMEGIYHTQSIDQLADLIQTLKTNPMATKKTVTFWNPAEKDQCALTQCHWGFEILVEPLTYGERVQKIQIHHQSTIEKLADGHKYFDKLNIPKYQFTLKWHQHSVDTFLGLPFNIASYALLAQIIGKMTNMTPKGIIGDLSNVHIYEPHLDAVKEQLSRDVNKYGKCDLSIGKTNEFFRSFDNIDEILSHLKINDFSLKGYNSYPAIPAEMLAYS